MKIDAQEGGATLTMTEAKLWHDPCPFAYRLNYLALRYNVPLYSWVEREWGLARPDIVVLWSLGVKDNAFAQEIAESSGFPPNTLSRAVHRLTKRGLVRRGRDGTDGRRQVLSLTEAGRALFLKVLPLFQHHETRMLAALDSEERRILSDLMAKMVRAAPGWPASADELESPCA